MIPGLLAQDVAKTLREFIITGFETETWPFAGKFEQLVNEQNNGEAFIKGPYVSISLPFAKETEQKNFFNTFDTQYSPFVHQQRAWERLQSNKHPQNTLKSTLIATGTGSGKTECFLYPILDHCLRNPKQGIKAIIIYPMNALAGDQAKRFAAMIHNTTQLKNKIRVGLFIGGKEVTDDKHMSAEQVITCKKTLRENPPDILLTNYKMLDYLLMRPRDQQLWQHNDPETLKYLVVDELHTFDGAQGSDLAMLLRRLKARLKIQSKNLTCVGTSATLGSETQMDDLADYATDIFDTHFDRNSIIAETRQTHEQFLDMIEYMLLDPSFKAEELSPDGYHSINEYLQAQTRLFFTEESEKDLSSMADRQELGRKLRKHPLLHNLLYLSRSGPVALQDLIPAVQKQLPANLKPHAQQVLISLLSLLSHACGERYSGEPFVSIRLQLWARELRRIVARVGNDSPQYPVQLQFSDDLKVEIGEIYLPTVQCNECHTTAWLTCIEAGESHVEQDLRKIYTKYFANSNSGDRRIRVLLPIKDRNKIPPTKGLVKHLCVNCGHLQIPDDACRACLEGVLVSVFEPDLNKRVRRGGIPTDESQRNCPVCQADSSLILFGSRAASLSSVVIHQMFANPINDDKKLIAFSDSVQDAAHRSGFFAARTWRNNIRMALAKTIAHYISEQQQAIPLQELFRYLPQFWLKESSNPEQMTSINYITQFIAPNLQTHEDYLGLKKYGHVDNPDQLIEFINKRFIWETLFEFGFHSRVGRSLERTGVAALVWSPELIETAKEFLVSHAREKLGYDLGDQQASFMLWGIALRIKRQGAIFHEFLQTFIEDGGQYFILNKIPFLPKFGDYSPKPKFPGVIKERSLDQIFPKKQSTWYSRWVTQLLGSDQLVDDLFVQELLTLIMASLVRCGLLLELSTRKGNKVWALNPQLLQITNELSAVRLQYQTAEEDDDDQENSQLNNTSAYGSWFIPAQWQKYLIDLPSLEQVSVKNHSPAVYKTDSQPRQSMYKAFYLNGEIHRVIGHEHTALLERDYREALEQRFMTKSEHRRDWYENLLSATPTLEMGIDIGDLSSVMLCSVPPSQANYLQRAGRGGRKDGKSFVMTLANGHPHDLYFYADPLKMLAGDIQAPAIFLNASMVLRRQLLAFSFDQWGMKQQGEQLGTLQPVLDAVENHDVKKFPYTLLDFIKQHRDELWDGFNQLLGHKVMEDTRQKLKSYLLASGNDDDALHVYVLGRIQSLVDERQRLTKQQRELETELRALQKRPQDDVRDKQEDELTTELEGVKRLKSNLNYKETLNFFTDDGLLPNYAFPEEGTTLRSVIYRRVSQAIELDNGKTSQYVTETFEYSRPAHSALSELAPESIFYASNRKVKIERVEMAKGENLEYWRMCPSCSYSEQIIGADKDSLCPRCHDPMWANVTQRKPMVRLRQVYAKTREDQAQIADDSDTREPTFYNRQMLIDFSTDDIGLAYAMETDTRPFGFEFIKQAKFKEINFGKQGDSDQVFNVAGQEMARPGFRLCKECGTVQHGKNAAEHLFKCQYRGASSDNTSSTALLSEQNSNQQDDGIIDCLYLYRQYNSEAIRILMPGLSVSMREQQIQSFVAALQLGLKARFGGKVDHLHITTTDEPIAGSTDRANYLVIYDTVPGGTGYLHTLLANPQNLMDTLKLSQKIMAECSCQELPELDGCYSCLYAYKNSYGMENTSRRTALTMLADILDENIDLKPVPYLGTINKNSWADSVLESRFPDAIQALNQHAALDGIRIRVSKDIINGKVGFKLEVGDLIYSMELHPRLDQQDGVAYPCEPDFLISLDRENDAIPPVAVFLDGYSYHKDIVQQDLLKRQGIFLSGNRLTWSLTWHDINHVFAGSEVKIPNVYRENTQHAPKAFIRKISEQKGLLDHHQIAELNPLLMLMKFLANPSIERWSAYAALRTLSWLDQQIMQDQTTLSSLKSDMASWPSQFVDKVDFDSLNFSTIHKVQSQQFNLSIYIAGKEQAVTALDLDSLVLAVVFQGLETDHELTNRSWQKLLQILNLGQFLPLFFAGTERGIQEGHFSKLEWGKKTQLLDDSEWDSVLVLADEEMADLIQYLSTQSIPIPEVGYELANEKGAAIAEAELTWEAIKVAVLLPHQVLESKTVFEKNGWLVVTIDTDKDVIRNLICDRSGGISE